MFDDMARAPLSFMALVLLIGVIIWAVQRRNRARWVKRLGVQ